MTNFELLKEECDNYWENNYYEDSINRFSLSEIGVEGVPLVWGTTSYESFLEIVLQAKKPKRFVIFGCSIGYLCFYWNQLFPEIPCVGIDLMEYRVNWGKQIASKYLVKNVELILGDIQDFEVQDGDLIWQNNLLFNDQDCSELSQYLMKNYDIETISYKLLKVQESIFDDDDFHFYDKNGNVKIYKPKHLIAETSWTPDQNIVYYYRYRDEYKFDVNYINPEFRVPENLLKDYYTINTSKKFVISDTLRKYYNKFYLKEKFKQIGFNVPETYFYTETETDLPTHFKNISTFVAKPVHMSESNGVFIKPQINSEIDFSKINTTLNNYLKISDKNNWRNSPIEQEIYWKNTTPGIIIEEYINVIYELKVFVVFGEPVIGDLRFGSQEIHRVDFITKENQYLNWGKEYNLIVEFVKELKIDFLRIDFLYDGNKLYATECAFMPGTYLPEEVEQLIANKLRMPYLRHYYPNLC